MKKHFQTLIISLILTTIYLLCVYTRIEIRKTAELRQAGVLPFTLESAFLFYFSNLLAEGQKIPFLDFKAQYPEGLDAEAKLSLTVDHILSTVYRSCFKKIPYTEFVRTAQPFFLSLAIFLIFWICYSSSNNALLALGASLIYGLSTFSVVRSTGIEYSRENFALPFLFFHFALMIRPSQKIKTPLAALSLALSLMIWDGAQIYFILWVLYEICRFLFRPSSTVHPPSSTYLSVLIPCALLHPYFRDHQFLYSPGMMGLYSLCLIDLWHGKNKKLFFSILFFCLFSLWLFSPYLSIYSHMIQLIGYKIKFLNVKPQDPALLPFDVRLLWTPALQSFPLRHFKMLLPLLILALPGIYTSIKEVSPQPPLKIRGGIKLFFLLYFFTAFLILSLAFVRLEVYLVFFLACLIGSIPGGILQRNRLRLFWNTCILLTLLAEAECIAKDFSQFERAVPYSYLEDVTRWTRENTPKNACFLAPFGLSPSLLTYGERAIVLHPKYESEDMREKIQAFAIRLFESEEDPFYQYCLKNGVHFYVHALGTFQDSSAFSWGYMANRRRGTKGRAGTLLAERFEYGKFLKRFSLVHRNGKYLIYRIIGPQDARRSQELKKEAEKLTEQGHIEEAEEKYFLALKFNPNDFMIYFRMAKLYQEKGQANLAIQATKEGLKRASPASETH
ncbi:MAG: hypothetical protein HYZ67_03185 [Chlamydiae bacterium]|nr:hypothetical protein [Chlamydiota bacterium]